MCQDVVDGTRNNHGLFIEKRSVYCTPLDGELGTPDTSHKLYNSLRPTWANALGALGATLPPPKSDNLLATDVLSRSNPSRPEVDLGVTIAELREAPQLLFKAGRNMLRNGANFYLSYEFGWKPLVNDILDLMDVPATVHKRTMELEGLTRNGGLRRRVQLGTVHNKEGPEFVYLETRNGDPISGLRTRYSTRKSWGTQRWTPTVGWGAKLPKTPPEMISRMRNAAYGLTVDASTAWNLIPWSWCIDWFGSMGDFLAANRNIIGLSGTGGTCIMHHRTDFDDYKRQGDYPTITGGEGFTRTETKTRVVVPFIMPELYVPFLGPRKLSILGSLGVLRLPR